MSAPTIKQDIQINIVGLKKLTKMVKAFKSAAKESDDLEKSFKDVDKALDNVDWNQQAAEMKKVSQIAFDVDSGALKFVERLKKATEEALQAYTKMKKAIEKSNTGELKSKKTQEQIKLLREEIQNLRSRTFKTEARTAKVKKETLKVEQQTKNVAKQKLIEEQKELQLDQRLRIAKQRTLKLTQQAERAEAKGTNEVKKKVRWYDKLLKKLRLSNQGIGGMTASFSGFINNLRFGVKMSGPFIALMAVVSALRSAFRHVVKPAIAFEAGMAHVSRTTKILGAELKELTKKMSGVAAQTGQTHDNIAKIGTVAGQLGIKGVDNIVRFTKTVAQMERVTDLNAEKAATAIAKIAQAFKLPISMAREIGSVVNELANNTTAGATEITKALGKIGPVASNLGITLADTAAMVTTLIDTGLVAPRAGTNLRNLFILIQNKSGILARFMGETAQKFTDDLVADPMLKLEQYFDVLYGATKWTRAKHVKEVYGQENFAALETLFSLQDEFKKSRDLAREAFAEGTSMQSEYVRMMSTVQGQWDFVKQTFNDILIMLGTTLLPMLEDIARDLVGLLGNKEAKFMNIEHWEHEHQRKKIIQNRLELGKNFTSGLVIEVPYGLAQMLGEFKKLEPGRAESVERWLKWKEIDDEIKEMEAQRDVAKTGAARLEASIEQMREDPTISAATIEASEDALKKLEKTVKDTERRLAQLGRTSFTAKRAAEMVDEDVSEIAKAYGDAIKLIAGDLIAYKEKGELDDGYVPFKEYMEQLLANYRIEPGTYETPEEGVQRMFDKHPDDSFVKLFQLSWSYFQAYLRSKAPPEQEDDEDKVNIMIDKERKLFQQIGKWGDTASALLGRQNKDIMRWGKEIVDFESKLKRVRLAYTDLPEFAMDPAGDDPTNAHIWAIVKQDERLLEAIKALRQQMIQDLEQWIRDMEGLFQRGRVDKDTGELIEETGLVEAMEKIWLDASMRVASQTTGRIFDIDEKKVPEEPARDFMNEIMAGRYEYIGEKLADPKKFGKVIDDLEKTLNNLVKDGMAGELSDTVVKLETIFGQIGPSQEPEEFIRWVFELLRDRLYDASQEVDVDQQYAHFEKLREWFDIMLPVILDLNEMGRGVEITPDVTFDEKTRHTMAKRDIEKIYKEVMDELEATIDRIFEKMESMLDRIKTYTKAIRTLMSDGFKTMDIMFGLSQGVKDFARSMDAVVDSFGVWKSIMEQISAHQDAMQEYERVLVHVKGLNEVIQADIDAGLANKGDLIPLPTKPEFGDAPTKLDSILAMSNLIVAGLGAGFGIINSITESARKARAQREAQRRLMEENHRRLLAKLDELKESERNLYDLTGEESDKVREAINNYDNSRIPQWAPREDHKMFQLERARILADVLREVGVLPEGMSLSPGLIDELRDQVFRHGGFNNSVDGLIGSINFLGTYLETEAKDKFKSFVDGLSDLEGIPDWLQEALTGIDLSTEEGRETLRELIREWAFAFASGELALAGITPGQFEKMLAFLEGLAKDGAKESNVKTIGVSRVITDVQANAVIALLEQQVYWQKALAEFIIFGQRPPIAPTASAPLSTVPYVDTMQSYKGQGGNMSTMSVNFKGDIVINTPVSTYSPHFSKAAGQALQDHLNKYKGRANRI